MHRSHLRSDQHAGSPLREDGFRSAFYLLAGKGRQVRLLELDPTAAAGHLSSGAAEHLRGDPLKKPPRLDAEGVS